MSSIDFFLSGSVPLILVIVALFQKVEWRKQIKSQARSYFYEGAWFKFALCMVGSILAVLVGSAILGNVLSILGYVVSLVGMSVLSYGAIDVMKRIQHGKDFSLRDFFPTDQMGVVVGAAFIKNLYLFFWSLLFVIPGIIKTYSYSQTMFILNDHPEYGIDEAITKSREMMNGHKWELVILQSSFLGWAILGSLTFGLGIIYILPLYSMSMYVFYEYVKKGYVKSSEFENVYHMY